LSLQRLVCNYSVVDPAAHLAIQRDVNIFYKICILLADLLKDDKGMTFFGYNKTVPRNMMNIVKDIRERERCAGLPST